MSTVYSSVLNGAPDPRRDRRREAQEGLRTPHRLVPGREARPRPHHLPTPSAAAANQSNSSYAGQQNV